MPAPDIRSLPAVVLPDLTRMEAPVQAQLRAQFVVTSADAAASPTDAAREYGQLGRLLMAAEYFEAAEPCFLHAQALAPNEMRWPYYLGHVYEATSAPVTAIASYERALQLQPGDVATMVWLANVHLAQGDLDAAERLFAQVLSTQPRLVAALFGGGRVALARRDFARAVDQLERALAADPRAAIAHYPLALAYRGLGDSAKAEAHLRQQGGVEVGPPDPLMVELRDVLQGSVAEEARGVRALDARNFSAAVQHFGKAVELAPENPAIRHRLGTALSLAGDTAGAIAQFEDVIARTPSFAQAHYSLGVLAAANGRHQQAVEHLSAAVRYEPRYVEARMQLAEALRLAGRLEQSLRQYEAVLESDSGLADARFAHAMTLVALRRTAEARDAFREAARLHPDEPRFAEMLAKIDAATARGRPSPAVVGPAGR
jgi:tetratricopeptide (TPR) repeat protein